MLKVTVYNTETDQYEPTTAPESQEWVDLIDSLDSDCVAHANETDSQSP